MWLKGVILDAGKQAVFEFGLGEENVFGVCLLADCIVNATMDGNASVVSVIVEVKRDSELATEVFDPFLDEFAGGLVCSRTAERKDFGGLVVGGVHIVLDNGDDDGDDGINLHGGLLSS